MGKERLGFASFESLVTDLSDLPPLPPPSPTKDKLAAAPATSPRVEDNRDRGPPRPAPTENSPAKWILTALIVGAVGLAIFWIVNNTSGTKQASVAPRYPTSTYTPPTPPPGFVLDSPQPSPRFQPSVEFEDKPPVGEGIALSTAQLRYCLAQRARIEGGQKALNKLSQAEVNNFNALVDDYNLRCSNYRYRQSEMQTVKAGVDGRRAELERQGAALLRSLYSR